jgi:16S rRNA (uracil1498-N3)-methyltransferase
MAETLFYYSDLAGAGERVTLAGDEAHHAASVRRLRVGDALMLFDGRGLTAQATVQALHPRGREIELVVGARSVQPAPQPPVHVASALPKGDRLATLVDMATQLGMTSFTPLLCERAVVQPSENLGSRLRRLGLEACKQSRRAWLPQFLEPATLPEVVRRGATEGAVAWLAHPGGRAAAAIAGDGMRAVTVLVGPEGGFTDEEVRAALAAGAQAVTLGEAILRIETAVVALLAAIRLRAPQA